MKNSKLLKKLKSKSCKIFIRTLKKLCNEDESYIPTIEHINNLGAIDFLSFAAYLSKLPLKDDIDAFFYILNIKKENTYERAL